MIYVAGQIQMYGVLFFLIGALFLVAGILLVRKLIKKNKETHYVEEEKDEEDELKRLLE